jgi:predicted ABC-type ATPase
MNTTAQPPLCVVIAGPNGAGKTTFALRALPGMLASRRFINADLIAYGLAPLAPETRQLAAGRLFLQEVESAVAVRQSFAFETTLSGKGHLALLRRLRADAWRIELIYLALPDVGKSLERVALRVAHGGHDIPEDAVRRRFARSLRHLLGVYSEVADLTMCFMNLEEPPELVFVQDAKGRSVRHEGHFRHLVSQAQLT